VVFFIQKAGFEIAVSGKIDKDLMRGASIRLSS
jgi:hypothetical protein